MRSWVGPAAGGSCAPPPTTAAVVGASGALAAPALAQDTSSRGGGRHRVPRDQISIQLYTLRDQLAIDFEGTIATLAEIGYTRVEHAGFVGRTVTEFKAVLDANNIVSTSGHVQIPQPFDPTTWAASLADANTLGSRYIVHPFFGINFGTGEVVRTTAPWQAFARDLNRAGRMARDAGIKLGYHNHNWEFFRLTDNPSRTAYDVLTDTTDPDLVHLELDLFWATRGARDPVDLIQAEPGPGAAVPRQGHEPGRQLHRPRPMACSTSPASSGHSDTAGVREYIVERDDAGSPPREPADALETARVGYQFLRTVRF